MSGLKVYEHQYQGFPTVQREDGYWEATKLCAAKGKRFDHYMANGDTANFLAALATESGIPVRPTQPISPFQIIKDHFPDVKVSDKLPGMSGSLIQAVEGRNGGTWVHRKVAIHLAMWLDASFAVWVINKADELMATGRVSINGTKPGSLDEVLEAAIARHVAPLLARIEELERPESLVRRIAGVERQLEQGVMFTGTAPKRGRRAGQSPRPKSDQMTGRVQQAVLAALRDAGPDGLTCREIADATGEMADSIRKATARAGAVGYVTRHRRRWRLAGGE